MLAAFMSVVACAAFLAAQAQQASSGDALYAAQLNDAAQTAQTQIAANASVANNQTWANAQQFGDTTAVQTARINSQTAIAVAPYAVQANLVSQLGNIASQPGAVVTSSQSNNGFFGLGASSSSSSSYLPNPGAINAGNILGSLAGNLSASPSSGTGYTSQH